MREVISTGIIFAQTKRKEGGGGGQREENIYKGITIHTGASTKVIAVR